MLLKRIIPCLDVDQGRVVKGVQYVDHVDAGDPVEVARMYDEQEADEITFLDITASHEQRRILLDVVARTAETVFMPLCVGGGVRSLQDVRDLLNAGADKVSIMTAAVHDPELVAEAAAKIGSANLVVAIDAKRIEDPAAFRERSALRVAEQPDDRPGEHPTHEVYTHGGRRGDRDRRRGLGPARWRPGRRRDPAHQHGPRRHQERLRPRPGAGRGRRRDRSR